MRKVLFCALAALALVLTSCDPNNPSNPTGDGNKYEGVWVSDSVIDANGDQYPHGAFWTILNSKEVEIHGWGTSCTWEEKDLVFTFHVGQEGFKIVMQAEQDIADERMALHVTEGAPYLNVPEGATLYMYRLPQPQGKKACLLRRQTCWANGARPTRSTPCTTLTARRTARPSSTMVGRSGTSRLTALLPPIAIRTPTTDGGYWTAKSWRSLPVQNPKQ